MRDCLCHRDTNRCATVLWPSKFVPELSSFVIFLELSAWVDKSIVCCADVANISPLRKPCGFVVKVDYFLSEGLFVSS